MSILDGKRLPDATLKLAFDILRRHFDTVDRVEPIVDHGSVNWIFAADVDGGDRVILRLPRTGDGREYAKEAWCLAEAAKAGIPSPTVIADGTHDGAAYMILTFVDGVNGKAWEGDRRRLWHTLGEYARRIHDIEVRGFGNRLLDADRGEFTDSHSPTWARYIEYNLESLTPVDPLIDLGVYTPVLRPRIVDCFERLAELPVRIGLAHNDLAPRNTLVDTAGRVTLLDWGLAHVGVLPHVEFSTILTWYSPEPDILDAFFDGYGLSRAEVDALMPELRLFQLVQTFDTLRWAIDHGIDVPRYVDRARAARQFLLPTS